MADFILRAMRDDEWMAVAELICASIRQWYAAAGKPGRFPGGPASCLLFPQVYEALDPGCCVVAEDPSTGRLAASCFYHPRPTHVSLGIMNAHPDFFGRGAATLVLQHVCDLADRLGKPLRLVSSAMNLDSFSLYTRAGFTPRAVYHTMNVKVPEAGIAADAAGLPRVRDGRIDDAAAIADLEQSIAGIQRPADWLYFLKNDSGIWHTSVVESTAGGIDGVLVSVNHPASRMLGPGVMREEPTAAALILAELNYHRGGSPTLLAPAANGELVRRLYQWGFRNSEIHLMQARGPAEPPRGIVMPTFMPETG